MLTDYESSDCTMDLQCLLCRGGGAKEPSNVPSFAYALVASIQLSFDLTAFDCLSKVIKVRDHRPLTR